MLKCFTVVTYLGQKNGITKDGEKYVSLEVRDNEAGKNYNFVTKDLDLVDKIINTNFKPYQDIKIELSFDRVFNAKSRFSNWQVELIDIKGLGVANG